MKLKLIETGGWTNIRTGCSIDTDTLPKPIGDALVRAVADIQWWIEPVEPPYVRDARTICIEVDSGDGWKRASFSEAAPPAEARPVLELLRTHCKPVPLSLRQ